MMPRFPKVEGNQTVTIVRTGGCTPVAALLFDSSARPDRSALAAMAQQAGEFSVTHEDRDGAGRIELLRDGLTFDLTGIAPAAPLLPPPAAHGVGLPQDFEVAGLAALLLAPGPHLAGAEHLLPVVRVTAALIARLAELPGLRAIAWLPARLTLSPAWFTEAVRVWLGGGPFPVLALTALSRSASAFESEGLAFFTGQEFALFGKDGVLDQADSRVAVRLTDWLVAHGRIDAARKVILAGTGPVWLEPNGAGRLKATCL